MEALYHLTRTLDSTRPVIGNDGWESSATDIIGINDYDANMEHLKQRYGGESAAQNLFDRVPSQTPWAGVAGAEYPVHSPYGFNGGFYYARLGWTF